MGAAGFTGARIGTAVGSETRAVLQRYCQGMPTRAVRRRREHRADARHARYLLGLMEKAGLAPPDCPQCAIGYTNDEIILAGSEPDAAR